MVVLVWPGEEVLDDAEGDVEAGADDVIEAVVLLVVNTEFAVADVDVNVDVEVDGDVDGDVDVVVVVDDANDTDVVVAEDDDKMANDDVVDAVVLPPPRHYQTQLSGARLTMQRKISP